MVRGPAPTMSAFTYICLCLRGGGRKKCDIRDFVSGRTVGSEDVQPFCRRCILRIQDSDSESLNIPGVLGRATGRGAAKNESLCCGRFHCR